MNRERSLGLLLIIVLAVALGSCDSQESEEETPTTVAVASQPAAATPTPAPPTPTRLTEPLYRLADVDSLEILTTESTPAQIEVRLRGVLPNGCTEIDNIITQREGNDFVVAVTTIQQPEQTCTEGEVPFEENVPIDVSGLGAGSYIVRASGLQGSFTLDADNLTQEETPTPEAAADSASVSGRVWHDLCSISGDEDADLASGCIRTDSDGLQADGLLEAEPGIEGIRVSIGEGACPSESIDAAITNSEGRYRFGNLASGVYCISIDMTDEDNQGILLAGAWTAPENGLPETTVTVIAGDALQAVNFGWDYRFLPIPDVDPASCTNSFEFVEDLNIPDDTVFAPGAEFTKRWLLRNNGTCPWTTDYSIVFVGGELMSAEESIPLTQAVAPGQTLEIAVDMIAPDELGTYRGNWQLANASGEPFGAGGFIEDAYWVQIVVQEAAISTATPLPNSAVLGGVVWEDFCLNSNPDRGCVEFPEDSGSFIADGTLDRGEPRLGEITITLADDICPADGTLPPAATIISTTITDEDGLYRFESLPDGAYCVFMDALSEENVDFLIPGNWTWPATGVGYYSVVLDPGEQILDLDFGWDYSD